MPTVRLNVPPAEARGGFRLHRRMDRVARLVGDAAMEALAECHVMVIGQGGVGSWASEALVRSGLGTVSLVDFDLVCATNANRQMHALKGTTGKPKVEVMAERLRLANPQSEVVAIREFYNAETSAQLLDRGPSLVIDAIDNLTAKTHLIAQCVERGIPLVVSGGASGRLDPTQVRESDMTEVEGDPFIRRVRKMLRKDYAFSREGAWHLPTIHSLEAPAMPQELKYDGDEGFRCVCPQGQNDLHSCEHRNVIYGTAGFVTGTFGFACAAAALRILRQRHQRGGGGGANGGDSGNGSASWVQGAGAGGSGNTPRRRRPS